MFQKMAIPLVNPGPQALLVADKRLTASAPSAFYVPAILVPLLLGCLGACRSIAYEPGADLDGSATRNSPV